MDTSPQSSQPNKATKYNCRKCGDNNSHSSETCRVIGKLIDDSQKSIRPKSNDKPIPIKTTKPDNKIIINDKTKTVKSNDKVKAGKVVVNEDFLGCTYCLTQNKSLSRCNSHTFANCTSRPNWLTNVEMEGIFINWKTKHTPSGAIPSTNTNNLSDYAGGNSNDHDKDPEVDYDFGSENEDLNE